jgi:four helix bundle protein
MKENRKQINTTKIRSFTDLQAWKEGHELVLSTYKFTKKLPKEEKFGLVDQMRRCVISITSNIAEGFARQGQKEKIQFYFTAKGSLTEYQNQLLVTRDVGYISKPQFTSIANQSIRIHKLVNGLIRSIKSKI